MTDAEEPIAIGTDSTGIDLIVDLGAVRHNVDVLKRVVSPSSVMAVVKNDAYGHGLLPVVRTVLDAGITWIGGLDVPTSSIIREAGIGHDIRLFAWFLSPHEDYAGAIEQSIDQIGRASCRERVSLLE